MHVAPDCIPMWGRWGIERGAFSPLIHRIYRSVTLTTTLFLYFSHETKTDSWEIQQQMLAFMEL